MKILHVSPSYYPAVKYGGPIFSVSSLNHALAQKGISVKVITTNAGLEHDPSIPLHRWTESGGVRIFYCKYYGYEHYNFSTTLLREVFRQAGDCDIVHLTAVWNFPVWAGSMAGLFYGKPYIISPRGTIYPETVRLKSTMLKTFYYHMIARHYLKRGAIHFTSEDERSKVTDFLKLNVPAFVVPNGMRLDQVLPAQGEFFRKYPELKNKRYILFLGRIHPKKGLDILVKAFGLLAAKYPDLYLVVAGPDDENYARFIKQEVERSGQSERVIFPGMLEDEKWCAYRDACLFVLPSYSENFGMAVIEAMVSHIPVVISNQVGIYGEIERHNAGVVVSPRVEDVYEGIRSLLDNEELRMELAENGNRFVRSHYGVDSVADRMIEVYRTIVSGKKSRGKQ